MIVAALLAVTLQSQAGDTALLQYETAGVRVIHQPRRVSQIVSVQLYLLGGASQLNAHNAGVEPLYLRASAYGTGSYPGEQTRKALARTGSFIGVSAESDWTVYSFDGLAGRFDSTWSVFADRLLKPTLDSASVAVVRARMLSEVLRRRTSPEDEAWLLADSLALRGHPYAHDPDGSVHSLPRLTPQVLRDYARDQFVTSRMLLVVVGDVSRSQVEAAVQRSFGGLPRGSYVWSLPPPLKPAATEIAVASRTTTTNYLVGVMAGPPRSSPDYPAFDRAQRLLGGWISYVVRERATLSYAAGVAVYERGAPGAAIYVSTTRPDSAVRIINKILSDYESVVTVPRPTLRAGAKSFTSAYVNASESSSGLASLLGRAALYDGDPTAASRKAEVMGKIAFHEMRSAIRTHARSVQWAFVGDTTRVPRTDIMKRK